LLTGAQRDRIEVVLVSPRNPLNIGAVARAMANFGFTRLTVVDPFEAHWREARSAVGAESLLQDANVCATLAAAVAECTLVIGTGTRTHRKPEQPVLLLPELVSRVGVEMDRSGRAALVFGSEKSGLTRDDLAHCHLMVEIPTDDRQPSMNLGQAVAVCLYELCRVPSPDSGEVRSEAGRAAATSRVLDLLAELIQGAMLESGYSPKTMQAANRHDLLVVLRRLRWTSVDAKRALGLFRRVLFGLQNRGKS
jgi:tRNA/rRNA methyltransferase